MRVVVAPAAYRGSLSPLAVAQAMERGVLKVFPDADVRKIPMVDGGEGFVEALVVATSGVLRETVVTGVLGAPIPCQWGVLGDGRTAVIELASVFGPSTGSIKKREWRTATTFGLGELLRAALDAGLRRILIGIGGGTGVGPAGFVAQDGGAGMLRALGARFLDARRRELPLGGAALSRLVTIDLAHFDRRVNDAEIIVAGDVDSPLMPPRSASMPGVDARERLGVAEELDAALWHYAQIAHRAAGSPVVDPAGAGVAGGLGAGLLFFTPALLRRGMDVVFNEVRLPELVKDARFVLTGEGRTDFQTAFGKAPVAVARIARRLQVPVYCLSGSVGEGADETLSQGIDAVLSICDRPMTLADCMQNGAALVEAAAARLCRVISAAGNPSA